MLDCKPCLGTLPAQLCQQRISRRLSGVAPRSYRLELGVAASQYRRNSDAFPGSSLLLRGASQSVAVLLLAALMGGATSAQRLPSVDVNGNATRSRSLNTDSPTGGTILSTQSSVGVGLSWEIDIFGRVRHSVEAARLVLTSQIGDLVLAAQACELSAAVLMAHPANGCEPPTSSSAKPSGPWDPHSGLRCSTVAASPRPTCAWWCVLLHRTWKTPWQRLNPLPGAAQRVLDATQARWNVGAVSLFEVEDARRQLTQAQDDAIAAAHDSRRAWISLVRASGHASTATRAAEALS